MARSPKRSTLKATAGKDHTVKLSLINAHIKIATIPMVEFSLPYRLDDITSINIPTNTLGTKFTALFRKAMKISFCF